VGVDLSILAVLIKMGLSKRWLFIYAVHPLVLKEAIASAHPDGVMVLFLLLATVFWSKKSAVFSGIFFGAAIATKVSALAVLPLLLISPHAINLTTLHQFEAKNWFDNLATCYKKISTCCYKSFSWAAAVMIGSLTSLILIYLPFWNKHANELSSLIVFGQQWRFNPLLFRLLENIPFIDNARLVAGSVVMAGIMLIMTHWILTSKHAQNSTPHPGLPPLDIVFLLLLLFSPVVNSWYWLWVLPLAIMQQRFWLVVFCCGGVLAYINGTVFYDNAWYTRFFTQELFAVPFLVSAAQLGLLVGCLFAFKAKFLHNSKTIGVKRV
jgi:hypothetical protein